MVKSQTLISALGILSLLPLQTTALCNHRPFRGAVKLSVLLCTYKDAAEPAHDLQFYQDLLINDNTGGHADYWADVSHDAVSLSGSVVRGWYTLDQTVDEAKEKSRNERFSDCVNQARSEGYTAPADHLVLVITSPSIDIWGSCGGAFLDEYANVALISHEVAHGLGLQHSFTTDISFCPETWSSEGGYGDPWDIMSYGNVYSIGLGTFGRGGPGLNAYHLDRMGWLSRNKILRFGWDGKYDMTVTLTALTRLNDESGYHMVRIPFDRNDLNHYYTIEYRVAEDWDGGIGSDRVLIHEISNRDFYKCSTGKFSEGDYRSYVLSNNTGPDTPEESMHYRNGVKVELISKNSATGEAQVHIYSTRPLLCVQGFVWREAQPTDRVCVTSDRWAEVREENKLAESRVEPGGGAYGPDTCRQGFVWREAFQDDHVCVPPSSRSQVHEENGLAHTRRIGSVAYGPLSCKRGYVWRRADDRDWVCVTPDRRSEVREENELAESRVEPGGGAYGPDTCRQGFVWREAFPDDHVCVWPSSRSQAREENEAAHGLLANEST